MYVSVVESTVFVKFKEQYMTLDHKTSHMGQFFEIEIYTSES